MERKREGSLSLSLSACTSLIEGMCVRRGGKRERGEERHREGERERERGGALCRTALAHGHRRLQRWGMREITSIPPFSIYRCR